MPRDEVVLTAGTVAADVGLISSEVQALADSERALAASAPPSRVGDLHTVRFYPNGRVSCWVARGRDLQQVRELDGRTKALWPAIEARLAPDTRFWLNAHGVPRPIPADEVSGFVRTQMGWR